MRDSAMPSESSEEAIPRVSELIEVMQDSGDLYKKLTKNGTVSVSGLGGHFYSEGAPEFNLLRRIAIPDELVMQIRNMRTQFCMGLFTEISRAWITIDSDIFMWNYETCSDLAYFDTIESTVMKIDLVKVKPGVFASEFNYALVVGTIRDISLFPMSVEVSPALDGSVSVDPTHFFRAALDNMTIGDIVSSDSGRVFFTGDEKLYEFVYEHQRGWFRDGKKCRVVNHSASFLATFIPFMGHQNEELEQIAIDKSRHILYTLDRSGTIQVFDLGADGQQCSRFCHLTAGQIANQANLMTQCGHEDSSFSNIVTISPLEAQQSAQLNLVAVTAKGVRIYFSVLDRAVKNWHAQGSHYQYLSQQEVRPQRLRVVHVRFAPGVVPSSLYGDSGNKGGVCTAYYDGSTAVMATTGRPVVCALSDLFYPDSSMLRESKTDLNVPGNVWAITSVVDKGVSDIPINPVLVPPVHPHALQETPLVKKNRLLVASTEGLYEFERNTPVDSLRDALMSGGADGRATADLLQQFGQTELLIMALEILVSNVPMDHRIKEKASALFFCIKDTTRVEPNFNEPWSPSEDSIADWKHKMRSPLQASTPHFERKESNYFHSTPGDISSFGAVPRYTSSHRHDALYYYFARLMIPIWSSPICKLNGKKLDTTMSLDQMGWLSERVRAVASAMEKYRLLPQYEQHRPETATARVQADANNAERQSLRALNKLMLLTAETLSLWMLMKKFDLSAISAGMEHSVLLKLAECKFFQLVDENDSYSGDVIRALIKFFLGDEAGTRELSDTLRRDCPTLYSADDACVTNAMEQLRQASQLPPGSARRRMVNAAADLLAQSILKVPLPTVCQELSTLGGYEYIVDLCLLRAQKEDPRQLALLAYRHGKSVEDSDTRHAMESRQKSYEVLTSVLEKLHTAKKDHLTAADATVNFNAVVLRVFVSEDEMAHAALFRWMLNRSMTNDILQSKSKYVESFLTHEISTGGGQKYLDLLWRWYEKNGCYGKAATLLSRLADNDNASIGLSQRFMYLSHAIMCAQSSSDANVMNSIDDLKDRVEVTRIQLVVKEALEAMKSNRPEIRDAIKTLDSQVIPLKELLLSYAMPFKLYRAQLAIFHCGNLYDLSAIEEVWENLIDNEMANEGDPAERLKVMLKDLYAIYGRSTYFPSKFIVRRLLEKGSGVTGANKVLSPHFFVSLLEHINMSFFDFVQLVHDEYQQGDPYLSQDERGIKYIFEIGTWVVEYVLTHRVPNRSLVVPACFDLLSGFLLAANDVGAPSSLRQSCSKLETLLHRLQALN